MKKRDPSGDITSGFQLIIFINLPFSNEITEKILIKSHFVQKQKEMQGVSVTRSNTSSALDQPEVDRRRKEDLVLK